MKRLKLNANEMKQIIADTLEQFSKGTRSVTITLDSLLKMSKPKDEDKPKVIVTEKAHKKMQALVKNTDKEIAWHGTVIRKDDMTFVIKDILVYPQKVTGATVDSDDDLYPLWLDELDDNTFNSIRMQGHSHVNMGTSPSAVDLTFYETLIPHIKDFYIFIILNKSGSMWINLYDLELNLVYETDDLNVKFVGHHYDEWSKKEIEEYVQSKYTQAGIGRTIPVKQSWRGNDNKTKTKTKAELEHEKMIDDYWKEYERQFSRGSY